MARGIVLLSWSVELKIAFALRVRKQSLSAKNCRAGLHPSCMLCCLLATIVRSDDFQEVRSSDSSLRLFIAKRTAIFPWDLYRFRLHHNNKIESTVNTEPLSFSTPPSTVNSQQSTANNSGGVQPELILGATFSKSSKQSEPIHPPCYPPAIATQHTPSRQASILIGITFPPQ